MTTDRVSGSMLIIFSLLVIWESRILPLGTFRQPGPAYIPIVLASLLLLCGVFLIAAGGRRAPALSSIPWVEWRHALAIFAAGVFAALGIERLGYRLTVVLVLSFMLKVVERRSWALTAALAFVLAFGSFYLFHTLLRVPLPLGRLGF